MNSKPTLPEASAKYNNGKGNTNYPEEPMPSMNSTNNSFQMEGEEDQIEESSLGLGSSSSSNGASGASGASGAAPAAGGSRKFRNSKNRSQRSRQSKKHKSKYLNKNNSNKRKSKKRV
jgi:hypothetical protein